MQKKATKIPKQTKEEEEKELKIFIPYNSVYQLRKEIFIEVLPNKIDPDTKVFITEKVHGVNVCIVFDTVRNGFLIGKRNSFITQFIPIDVDFKDLSKYFTQGFFTNHVTIALEKIQK